MKLGITTLSGNMATISRLLAEGEVSILVETDIVSILLDLTCHKELL